MNLLAMQMNSNFNLQMCHAELPQRQLLLDSGTAEFFQGMEARRNSTESQQTSDNSDVRKYGGN